MDFSLHCYEKSTTSPDFLISKFNELRHQCFTGFYKLFTDGSKEGLGASSAAVCYQSMSSIRVPDSASILTAELHVVKLALGIAKLGKTNMSSSLTPCQHYKQWAISNLGNQLVLEIITKYTHLIKMGKQFVFSWIPSHVGIPGNENTDSVTKHRLNKIVTNIRIARTDLYPTISELCKSEWRQSWDNCVWNKLYAIKPRHKGNKNSMNRHDSTIITRLRIGHTRNIC